MEGERNEVFLTVQLGHRNVRAGLGPNEKSMVEIPAVVGEPLFDTARLISAYKGRYLVGTEALERSGAFRLASLFHEEGYEHDGKLDLRRFYIMLLYILQCLKIERTQDCELLIILSDPISQELSVQLRRVVFDGLNFKNLHIDDATNAVTRVIPGTHKTVVRLGSRGIAVQCIVNNLVVASTSSNLGGDKITNITGRRLKEAGASPMSRGYFQQRHAIEEIKCTHSKVLEKDSKGSDYNVVLEDELGKTHEVKLDMMEAYFNPSYYSLDIESIQETVVKAILSVNSTLRRPLATNIYLCGATAECPGFSGRLQNEIETLLNSSDMLYQITGVDTYAYTVSVKITSSSNIAVWLGGLMESQEIQLGTGAN